MPSEWKPYSAAFITIFHCNCCFSISRVDSQAWLPSDRIKRSFWPWKVSWAAPIFRCNGTTFWGISVTTQRCQRNEVTALLSKFHCIFHSLAPWNTNDRHVLTSSFDDQLRKRTRYAYHLPPQLLFSSRQILRIRKRQTASSRFWFPFGKTQYKKKSWRNNYALLTLNTLTCSCK